MLFALEVKWRSSRSAWKVRTDVPQKKIDKKIEAKNLEDKYDKSGANRKCLTAEVSFRSQAIVREAVKNVLAEFVR